MIISETGGKILLDTIAPFNTGIVASLKTNQASVDVTTVYYSSSASTYYVNTYKEVNPSKWVLAINGTFYAPLGSLSYQYADIYYYNIPSSTNTFIFDDWAGGYSYGDSVPVLQPFPTLPDESFYSLNATQNNSFSVGFTGNKPTYYNTQWQVGNISWTIYASPDSATLQPLNMLIALKSQRLQGQSLNNLKLSGFEFFNTQGLGYADYLAYVCDPAQTNAKRLSTAVTFTKYF